MIFKYSQPKIPFWMRPFTRYRNRWVLTLEVDGRTYSSQPASEPPNPELVAETTKQLINQHYAEG